MSLNPSSSGISPARTVPLALVAVGLLVTGGAAIAATAAYFELRPAAHGNGSHPVTPPANATNNTTRPGPRTLNLTDDLGRAVTVPYDPARVAVLSPSLVDPMFRLGLRSHIVAVDCYAPAFGGLTSDYSSDQITLWNLSSSMCVQVAPSFDYEALLSVTPQLVLASTLITVAAVESIEHTYGIPVLMLQPPTLSGIEVDVSMIGEIFHENASAAALNGQIQAKLAVAQNVTANLTNQYVPFPTVLVTYSVNPSGSPSPGYYTFGPGTFGQSLIELASATSIAANATYPYPLLTGDQVLLADPQVIIVGTGFGLTLADYAQGPDWSLLGAVANHTVYGVDSNWLTEPGPTMVLDGLPTLLHLLHPDLVPAP